VKGRLPVGSEFTFAPTGRGNSTVAITAGLAALLAPGRDNFLVSHRATVGGIWPKLKQQVAAGRLFA